LSRYDFTEFATLAAPLRFRRPSVGFATNSIKLLFQLSGQPNRYVWVDPPWELQRAEQSFLDSSSYPDPHSSAGRRLERSWLQRARLFRPGALLSLARDSDRFARFRFVSGWSLFVPAATSPRDTEQWYDDWYVADSESPPNKSLERTREG
jgi:hypothetical protein